MSNQRKTRKYQGLIWVLIFVVAMAFSPVLPGQTFAVAKAETEVSAPAKVTHLRGNWGGKGAINLYWYGAKNAQKYEIWVARSAQGTYKKVGTMKDHNKGKGTDYEAYHWKHKKAKGWNWYKVRAVNEDKNGKFSKVVRVAAMKASFIQRIYTKRGSVLKVRIKNTDKKHSLWLENKGLNIVYGIPEVPNAGLSIVKSKGSLTNASKTKIYKRVRIPKGKTKTIYIRYNVNNSFHGYAPKKTFIAIQMYAKPVKKSNKDRLKIRIEKSNKASKKASFNFETEEGGSSRGHWLNKYGY